MKKSLAKVSISGIPEKIYIPRLELTKTVIPGEYDAGSGDWSISPSGIHFATLSQKLNDYSGNTLLYAHNNSSAFGLLYLLEKGDKVEVKTTNGYNFTYEFITADDFDPADTSLFTYEGPPKLTLQTCSGYFNEYRRLYTFSLEKVEKI